MMDDHDGVSLATSPQREQLLMNMLEELDDVDTDEAVDLLRAINFELAGYGVRLG